MALNCDYTKKKPSIAFFQEEIWTHWNEPYPHLSSQSVPSYLYTAAVMYYLSAFCLQDMGHSRWGMVVKMLHQRPNISVKVGLFHRINENHWMERQTVLIYSGKILQASILDLQGHDRGNWRLYNKWIN